MIEVAPPGVRTGLMGQQDNEQAMPLDEFLTEALTLLDAQPDAKEIVVEGAKFARYAEANGDLRPGPDHARGRLNSLVTHRDAEGEGPRETRRR